MRHKVLVAFGLAAAWCTPLAAQICTPFTDIAASDPFCANVQWMHNRGITLGCTASTYCPAGDVTRLQMAAFMNRLGNVTFQQGGNAFGGPAVLGTTDNRLLDLRVNDLRAMRFEPGISPNIIAGSAANGVTLGVRGAAIAGGGVPAGNSDPNFSEGAPNRVTDAYGTVGGGFGNRAGDDAGTVIDAAHATVGGGALNTASGVWSVVGGGNANVASKAWGTVGGGGVNVASGEQSVIAGGFFNVASGGVSTVAGGDFNTASGASSTVAGGSSNVASGDFSFAAGQNAQSQNRGCFAWADASTFTPFVCGGDNAFVARAAGGFYLRTNAAGNVGASLVGGSGTWASVSDRALKENVALVDPRAVFERLVTIPISTWNYRSQDRAIRHMGPMAQDLHAAFGLGDSDKHISTIDGDGIALAAIQGLNAKLDAALREKDARIAALERRATQVDAMHAEIVALRALLAEVTRERAAIVSR